MYTQFFKLTADPFSIAPDPRYLFMSERHSEAMAHLLYGIKSGGGVVLLTGEIGAGKTTVCRDFLEQIPANCNVAYIFNPKLTVDELLKSICDEFRVEFKEVGSKARTVKDYVDALNKYLLATHAQGKNSVLVIDEAQNLSSDVLEQLRLLTNLETNERKLLQIILIGQPELRALLAKPHMEQLAQRVIARYHLDSLSEQETARYILHRLTISGLTSAQPFCRKLMPEIHRLTNGVPRRINLLCGRALLGAYTQDKQEVSRNTLRQAAGEVFSNNITSAPAQAGRWVYLALGLVAGTIIAGATAWTMNNGLRVNFNPPARPAPASKPSPTALVLSDLSGNFSAALRNEKEAYRQLAVLWGVSLQDGNPCQAALEKDLHCYQNNKGLAEIRQFNRPAILTLRDDGNKIYYALLTGLTNTSAALRLGNATRNVSLMTLAQRFEGNFATFWHAPKTYRKRVLPGDQGLEVDWLAAQLAKLNNTKEPPPNHPLDQALIKQVRQFQAAQGLKVDGIVGPRTFMYLNSAAGIKEPRLQTTPESPSPSPGN